MLLETSEYFLQRPCDERGGSQQNPDCNWSAWWTPNHGKEKERLEHLAKTILQGAVKGARRRWRQKKRWEDNFNEWTGMGYGDSLRAAEDREGWKRIVATSSVVPRRPPRLRLRTKMRNEIKEPDTTWLLCDRLYANHGWQRCCPL